MSRGPVWRSRWDDDRVLLVCQSVRILLRDQHDVQLVHVGLRLLQQPVLSAVPLWLHRVAARQHPVRALLVALRHLHDIGQLDQHVHVVHRRLLLPQRHERVPFQRLSRGVGRDRVRLHRLHGPLRQLHRYRPNLHGMHPGQLPVHLDVLVHLPKRHDPLSLWWQHLRGLHRFMRHMRSLRHGQLHVLPGRLLPPEQHNDHERLVRFIVSHGHVYRRHQLLALLRLLCDLHRHRIHVHQLRHRLAPRRRLVRIRLSLRHLPRRGHCLLPLLRCLLCHVQRVFLQQLHLLRRRGLPPVSRWHVRYFLPRWPLRRRRQQHVRALRHVLVRVLCWLGDNVHCLPGDRTQPVPVLVLRRLPLHDHDHERVLDSLRQLHPALRLVCRISRQLHQLHRRLRAVRLLLLHQLPHRHDARRQPVCPLHRLVPLRHMLHRPACLVSLVHQRLLPRSGQQSVRFLVCRGHLCQRDDLLAVCHVLLCSLLRIGHDVHRLPRRHVPPRLVVPGHVPRGVLQQHGHLSGLLSALHPVRRIGHHVHGLCSWQLPLQQDVLHVVPCRLYGSIACHEPAQLRAMLAPVQDVCGRFALFVLFVPNRPAALLWRLCLLVSIQRDRGPIGPNVLALHVALRHLQRHHVHVHVLLDGLHVRLHVHGRLPSGHHTLWLIRNVRLVHVALCHLLEQCVQLHVVCRRVLLRRRRAARAMHADVPPRHVLRRPPVLVLLFHLRQLHRIGVDVHQLRPGHAPLRLLVCGCVPRFNLPLHGHQHMPAVYLTLRQLHRRIAHELHQLRRLVLALCDHGHLLLELSRRNLLFRQW